MGELDESESRRYLTVPQLARDWQCGTTLIWRLVRAGAIPSVRIGRNVRIPARELEVWVAARLHRDGVSGVLPVPPRRRSKPKRR